MKIQYIKHRFIAVSLRIIEQANEIIAEYEAEGMAMTLRQIYYQFIARDWFPESWIDEDYNRRNRLEPRTKNTIKNYDKLQDLLNSARLAGLVSWLAMEDRTRYLRKLNEWDNAEQVIAVSAEQYKEDLWATQPKRIEVWIEKDALVGVLEQTCNKMRVPYFSCRGYTSQSEQWRAGRRLMGYLKDGQAPVILHFGDHDPSGIDMTRDNEQRLEMFAGGKIQFKRMALNMNQVRKYKPPPNPAKLTDSRAADYISNFGEDCWELDALEPRVIRKLIEDEINEHIIKSLWNKAVKKEAAQVGELNGIIDNYETIQTRLQDGTL